MKTPVAICLGCGKKFLTVKAAEIAAAGYPGCPKCGGLDIDFGVPVTPQDPIGAQAIQDAFYATYPGAQ